MPEPAAAPRVSLSYSWDSDEHCDWVLALANELVANGVGVVLDKWHLHEGDTACSMK